MSSIILNYSKSVATNIATPKPIINSDTLKDLIKYKNKIDELENTKIWDRAKKFSNEYELIHLPNKRNKKDSIALYEPLSRSYFKMWEMIIDYNLFEQDTDKLSTSLNICCLAEGPGGFIECVNNMRKKQDLILGITLKPTNREVPGWKKSKSFLEKNPNVHITYGVDGTGDLYNLKNILYLQSCFSHKKYDLITADGGFDFSVDFNNQEKMSYRIIFCEIVSALAIQAKGGHFVCKIFDIHTELTTKFIWLLTKHYKEIIITKPKTSRPANSEKYIVCKSFKGIELGLLNILFKCVEKWENSGKMFGFIKPPVNFTNEIYNYNETITNLQKENIKRTLEIINNYENIELTSSIIKNQMEKALEWCNYYNIEINKKSSFLC